MRVPKQVKIGAQIYRIIERSESEDGGLSDAYAYTLTAHNLIVLKKEGPADRKRSFLWHELLHALIFTFGEHTAKNLETYDDWEHHFIYLLQEPLTMLLLDNPELVEYLTSDEL